MTRILRQFLLAFFSLGVMFYAFALLFQPDWDAVREVDPEAAEEAVKLRRSAKEVAEATVFYYREVDYDEGAQAHWWPRGESPVLSELVEEGALPPVEERVGSEPLVMEGPDGIGNYGGNWLRLATGRADAIFLPNSRLGGPALARWSPMGYPIVPHLAKGWESSEDLREWTLYFRRGVRWSDGHPLTADDFLFNIDATIQMGRNPPPFLRVGNEFADVEKLDDYSVIIRFPGPNALFLENLARNALSMMPEHYLAPYHPESGDRDFIESELRRLNMPNARSLFRNRCANDNPHRPSLSPWLYPRDQRSAPYIFVRNPYFWAVDTEGNQLPYIDQVQFDERSIQLLSTSAYEGAVSMQHRHLQFDDYSLLMANRETHNYQVYHWTDAGTPWLIYPNLNRRVRDAEPESYWKAKLLKDKRFRQALSIGIDRREVIEFLFSGVGEPAQTAPYPGSPYYDPELKLAYTEYDPQTANRWLDELGLTGRDSGGYRTFPDGSRMTWFIDYGGLIVRGAAPLVVEYWRDLGLRVIERERSPGLLATERQALIQDFRAWDIFNIPLVAPDAFVPVSSASPFAMAYGNWFERGGLEGADLSGEGILVQEPAEDDPIRKAMKLFARATTAPEEETRIELFQRIMEIAAEEVWTIGINTPPPVLGLVRDGFRNVSPQALSAYTFLFISNVGPETYYFDEPAPMSPGAQRRLREWLKRPAAAVTDSSRESPPGETISGAGNPAGLLWSWLIRVFVVAGLLYAALRYPIVGRRLIVLVPTLAVMSIGIFWIIQIPPGDYVQVRIAQLEAQGDEAAIQEVLELRELFHLDEPVVMQYLRWTGLYWFVSFSSADTGLLQGDLGRSMETLQPVSEMVGDRLLLTMLVAFSTILFTYLMAIPIGIYSAVRQYSIGDYIFTFIGLLGLCLPNFLLALLLMFFSSRYLGIDATGLFSPEYAAQPEWTIGKFLDLLKHLWIPVVVVGTAGTAAMIRFMRGNLLDELRKPYVVTARAKGVRPISLLLRYPVRLAINPFISNVGSIFPRLVSGEAIVAIVISLPTVGPLLLEALLNQDMYMAGSLLMFLSVLGVLGTLVSDLLLMVFDPRIRLEQ